MWRITPMELLYCSMITGLALVGLLVGILEPHLPHMVTQMYRYGKFAVQKHRSGFVTRLEIPKSSFRHFYVFSIVLAGLTLYLIGQTCIGGESPPRLLTDLLDIICGTRRAVKGNALGSVMASFCIFLQCLRRFYESHFVQVFAPTSRINVLHYGVGFVHYIGATVAILAHAPGFVAATEQAANATVSLDQLTWRIIFSAVTFLFSWWQQWRANDTLARLRKDAAGRVVTQKHLLPAGGFFDVVSSPHMLFECLMYVALVPVLPGNTDWLLVTAWVVSNQAQVAHFTHRWYRDTFPHYPKARKALIPGIF